MQSPNTQPDRLMDTNSSSNAIPLDVVLESDDFCTDYVGLYPRGFGNGTELIATLDNLGKPETIYVEDLCQAGCQIKNHKLCTQTDIQLVAFGPHVRLLCTHILQIAKERGVPFHTVASQHSNMQYLLVRPVFFDGVEVCMYNAKKVAMEPLPAPFYYFAVTTAPHRLVVNIIRRSLAPFTSAVQAGRPFRFEIVTAKPAMISASTLITVFETDIEMAACGGAAWEVYSGLPPALVKDPTITELVSPFIMRQLPTHPAMSSSALPSKGRSGHEDSTVDKKGSRSEQRQRKPAELLPQPHSQLHLEPRLSEYASMPSGDTRVSLRIRLLTHFFLISSKNPEGRTKMKASGKPNSSAPSSYDDDAVSEDVIGSAGDEAGLTFPLTDAQLWHLRPFKPTVTSLHAAFEALKQYMDAHTPIAHLTADSQAITEETSPSASLSGAAGPAATTPNVSTWERNALWSNPLDQAAASTGSSGFRVDAPFLSGSKRPRPEGLTTDTPNTVMDDPLARSLTASPSEAQSVAAACTATIPALLGERPLADAQKRRIRNRLSVPEEYVDQPHAAHSLLQLAAGYSNGAILS